MSTCEQAAQQVVKLLKEKNLKVAFAESCTGGLVSKLITDVSGSSSVFDGGVVSYSNEVKASVLGVEKEMLETYGAVSRPVAVEMAEGVRKLIKSDIGIGITGIAGPESDSTNKPVGLVYVAISCESGVKAIKLNSDFHGDNVREQNRQASALAALDLVSQYADAYPKELSGMAQPTEILEKYRTERREENGNI